ncbi:hypothetical protein [Pikeienuella sp. HZG-20]|uniref:hypothetical protein n=1 Tax=Paludibacillus litoralis TaxID=3133267 RepID=UPI0030EC260C
MKISVSSSAELLSAVEQAKGGERIELQSGDYSSLALRNFTFTNPVTITSADTDAPTVFGGRFAIMESAGIRLESINFHLADDEPLDQLIQVNIHGSEDIVLSDISVVGRVPGPGEGIAQEDLTRANYGAVKPIEGQPHGVGVTLRDSKDVTLERVDVATHRTAVVIRDMDGVTVRDSHLHDIRNDGITITESNDILIADNLFDNFFPMLSATDDFMRDHSDFIQYWGTHGSRGIDGLEISGNVMLQGGGNAGQTQAIFGRIAESSGDIENIVFKNFSIHDNLINTSHPHGIVVSDVEGAEVHHNTILPAPLDPTMPSSTDGHPWITITTDARRGTDGAFDLSRGHMPEDVTVEQNLVVGAKDGDGVRVLHLTPQEQAAHDVAIADNAMLTTNPISANFWGRLFPQLLDDPATDVSALIGLDIGGVRDLAPWLIEAAAAINTTPPDLVSGGPGDDVLVAAELSDAPDVKLNGGDGDDRLIGGDGLDTLYGGAGDDVMTGGARGDMFSLSAPARGGFETDVITDLNFAEGDHISLTDGFSHGFFGDRPGPDSALVLVGRSAVISSDAALAELAENRNISLNETAAGDLEIVFDLDGRGVPDYVVRLEGYAATYRGDAEDGGPSGGADDDTPPPAPDGDKTEGDGQDQSGGSDHADGGGGDGAAGDGGGPDVADGEGGGEGGGGDDAARGGDGSDVADGGDGGARSDDGAFVFKIPDGPNGGHDLIENLALAGGDSLTLTTETPFTVFEQSGARHIRFDDGGHDVLIQSDAALAELARLGLARFTFDQDGVTISFDLERDGFDPIDSGYRLTIQGDSAQALAARFGDAAPQTPPTAPPAPPEERAGPEDLLIEAPDFAGGETIHLDGFPPGYFSGIFGARAADGSALEIASLGDLATLARHPLASVARGDGAGAAVIRFSLDDGNEAALTVDGLTLGAVDQIVDGGDGPAPQGRAGADRFTLSGGRAVDGALELNFDERDSLIFSGFENGRFEDGFANGSALIVRSLDALASLAERDGFSVATGAADGVLLTYETAAGISTIDIILGHEGAAAYDSLLFA